jgi:hypothetical protein
MGNFYTNYTLRGVTQQAVAAAMSGRTAVICRSTNDVVVVFDEASDRQDENIIRDLASKLSAILQCAILAVLNHDDDILWYQLYVSGERVDEYNSSPDYFDFGGEGEPRGPIGGDAAKLCRTFECEHVEYVEQILRKSFEDGYAFAFQRHADLFEALGLPAVAVGNAYASFGRQSVPEGVVPGDIIRTS